MLNTTFNTYNLIKFHEILSVKIPLDLRFIGCIHFIKFFPYNISEPGMSLE